MFSYVGIQIILKTLKAVKAIETPCCRANALKCENQPHWYFYARLSDRGDARLSSPIVGWLHTETVYTPEDGHPFDVG